jgi:hypothetical protein
MEPATQRLLADFAWQQLRKGRFDPIDAVDFASRGSVDDPEVAAAFGEYRRERRS